jgi:hypothetical protein
VPLATKDLDRPMQSTHVVNLARQIHQLFKVLGILVTPQEVSRDRRGQFIGTHHPLHSIDQKAKSSGRLLD